MRVAQVGCLTKRLANTPTISQATPDSFLPRWGKKPSGLAVFLGDRQPIRLLPLEGAVAVRRLRVHGAGAVYRLGLDNARGKRLPSPTPCNYPYHQALRASFLPRWGKKPWGGWGRWGQPTKRLLLVGGFLRMN